MSTSARNPLWWDSSSPIVAWLYRDSPDANITRSRRLIEDQLSDQRAGDARPEYWFGENSLHFLDFVAGHDAETLERALPTLLAS